MIDALDYFLRNPPGRVGFSYVLYQHPLTNWYQWVNSTDFASMFDMIQIYPEPHGEFGIAPFGITPFGGK